MNIRNINGLEYPQSVLDMWSKQSSTSTLYNTIKVDKDLNYEADPSEYTFKGELTENDITPLLKLAPLPEVKKPV